MPFPLTCLPACLPIQHARRLKEPLRSAAAIACFLPKRDISSKGPKIGSAAFPTILPSALQGLHFGECSHFQGFSHSRSKQAYPSQDHSGDWSWICEWMCLASKMTRGWAPRHRSNPCSRHCRRFLRVINKHDAKARRRACMRLTLA